MGSRIIRKRRQKAQSPGGERVFATIAVAVGVPLILAYLLVAADIRSDLSDLEPRKGLAAQTPALLGWPDLEKMPWPPQRMVKMLGYMMDGYTSSPEAAPVTMFILMPEAGHVLHPAHRIPDQMVEVRPRHPVPFKNRQLVWATGTLSRIDGKPDFERANYAMTNAVVEPALERDITRWFSP